MKSKLTFILTFFFVLHSTSSVAQEQSKDVTITASGSGNTQSEAQQSALRSATEQAFGVFISSKTEIFNDELVADQISSVASGNIKSFQVLSETLLPNGTWASTLKATVSVDKLTSFVQAKGIAVEVQGGLFAINIKQQLLNEEAEFKAIQTLFEVVLEQMESAFDYTVKSSEPKTTKVLRPSQRHDAMKAAVRSSNSDAEKTDGSPSNYEILLTIEARANKNLPVIAEYINSTLKGLNMSSEEIQNYKSLNKSTYPVAVVKYEGPRKSYWSRLNIVDEEKGIVRDLSGNVIDRNTSMRNANINYGESNEKTRKEILEYHRVHKELTGLYTLRSNKSLQHFNASVSKITEILENYLLVSQPQDIEITKDMYYIQESDTARAIHNFIESKQFNKPKASYLIFANEGQLMLKKQFHHILTLDEISQLNGYKINPKKNVIAKSPKPNETVSKTIVTANKPEQAQNANNTSNNGLSTASTNPNAPAESESQATINESKTNSEQNKQANSLNLANSTATHNNSASPIETNSKESSSQKFSTSQKEYVNELKCRLIISPVSETSFKYVLFNECQQEACSGLEKMEGEASTLQNANEEEHVFEEPGTIKFLITEGGKTIMVEPDPMFIGFDCAGVFNGNFTLQKQ
jgi:hypothetical protein